MSGFFLTALLAMAMAPMQAPSTQTSSKAADLPTAAHKDSNPAPATKAELTPTDPVITIHGLCAGSATAKGKSADCVTVVTKEQFDAVINSLNAIGPELLPIQRRQVAEGYAATLMNYIAAKNAGVERDPRFAEVMRLARMRAMGDMYKELMQEKARKIPPGAEEAYYKNHRDQFEELALRRIVLPRFNQANLKDEVFAAKAQKVITDIRDRVAKGEDLDKLQKEAFEALGVKDPPTTNMGPVRRGVFATDQEKQLFALKVGECTGVIELPSAFIIYKLAGRETLTLEKSKDEITRLLVKQNLDKQEQATASSIHIDYNVQYVGGAQRPGWIPPGQLTGAANKTHAGGDAKNSPSGPQSPK
jgi:hypothetical protein